MKVAGGEEARPTITCTKCLNARRRLRAAGAVVGRVVGTGIGRAVPQVGVGEIVIVTIGKFKNGRYPTTKLPLTQRLMTAVATAEAVIGNNNVIGTVHLVQDIEVVVAAETVTIVIPLQPRSAVATTVPPPPRQLMTITPLWQVAVIINYHHNHHHPPANNNNNRRRISTAAMTEEVPR